MNNKKRDHRARVVMIVISVILAVFAANLFYIQIIKVRSQVAASAVRTATVRVKAPRGDIYDRNGRLLVSSEKVNTVVFDYMIFPSGEESAERNRIILDLIDLFDEHGVEYKDKLPIKLKKGALVFDEKNPAEIDYLKSSSFLTLNYYASVENCFDSLVDRYELGEYDIRDQLKLATVYYSMHKDGFNASVQYEFAEKVPDEIVSVIKEQNDRFAGVDVRIDSERVYSDGTLAPHILGVVGAISPEEYEQYKDKGYDRNDQIGKSGIEYTLESYLRGEDGEKLITVDSEGHKTESYIKQPVRGNAVVLTIDATLQKTAQDSLAELIAAQHMTRTDVTSGACVAMDTGSNAVLAMASYPTYDLSKFSKQYAKLNADSRKPMWNRALLSGYSPGSTIKPAVAMAGLEEKVITDESYIYCTGVYTHYQDYHPTCTGQHGSMDVVHAIYNSCNIFFYETARLLGIEKLDNYFTMFGFGESTGMELYESEGILDSVALRESLGETWTPGLTIQAGIGHGDNLFTPAQMCSYVSTIANRGVRYKAHLVDSIIRSDYSGVIYKSENTVLSQASFKKKNWDLVQEGMLLVGTRSYADFSAVPRNVAAKTGTTSIDKFVKGERVEVNNGLIIAYAPYEKPEIAVSVIIEGAGSGGSTAPVASAVLARYFEKTEKDDGESYEGRLFG